MATVDAGLDSQLPLYVSAEPSSLVLRPSQSCSPSSDPSPVESRIKQDKSEFEEQERQRVTQEARAEKQQKKKVGELYGVSVWVDSGQIRLRSWFWCFRSGSWC